VSGCQKYRDYVVHVVIDAAPSQPATVTFTTGGTASNGNDYTITPASVVLDNSNLSRTLTIRVFDDAAVEGNEQLTIGYTLNNGGGNAVADSYNQTCIVNIIDDDAAPVATVTATQTWGSANLNTATS